jgi:hypothetical protein
MTPTDTVVTSSRYVRLTVATFVMAAIAVFLGFQLFTSHLGQTSRDVISANECQDESCVLSAAASRAMADLEDDGLLCRTKPGLTDTIVFEWKTTEVTVIDFATALRATSNGEGWVRRYCMPA